MTENLTPRTPTPLRGVVRSAITSRRSRAVLAGGVVLGLGATATLAAYSDSEWASGTFTAPAVAASDVLNLEGSRDGSSYGPDVTFQSTLDMTKMAPTTTYYAPLYLRTTSDTTVDADVSVPVPAIGANSNGALAGLVKVVITDATNASCDATNAASRPVVGAEKVLAETMTTAPIRIIAGPAGEASATTVLCFQFKLTERPAGTAPLTATATWTVNATQTP